MAIRQIEGSECVRFVIMVVFRNPRPSTIPLVALTRYAQVGLSFLQHCTKQEGLCKKGSWQDLGHTSNNVG